MTQDRQLELFQALTSDDHLDAVVDAQVFFDFHESESNTILPSKALLSDFLIDTLNLWVTDELLVEIDRNLDPTARKKSRKRAYDFQHISYEPSLAEHFEAMLRTLLPSRTNSQISDIRHLAKTAASDASTFVTRDRTLLNHAENIRNLVDINVLSPTQLIITVHELSEKNGGELDRISGTGVSWRQLTSFDLSKFPTTSFVDPGDRHAPFIEQLNTFVAQPHRYRCTVHQIEGTIVALRVLDNREEDCVHVSFARITHMRERGLLERFMITNTLATAVTTGRKIIRFEKSGVTPRMASVLHDAGFIKATDAYVRYAIPSSLTRQEVLAWLSTVNRDHHTALRALDDLQLQRHCAPLCVTGATQTYMIPIRPEYAMSLFDINQAGQDLFGGNINVLFRSENVYYRNAAQVHMIQAPGLILWYESAPRKCIVAISLLDAVLVDKPKALFRTFRKFGILDWRELYAMCDGDTNRNLMAIKFSHTFLFRNPVTLNELNRIYRFHGKRPILQSPSRVSQEISKTILERGFEVQQ